MASLWIIPVFLCVSLSSGERLVVNDQDTILQYPGSFECTGNDILWEIDVEQGGWGVVLIVNDTVLDPDQEDHLVFSADETMIGEEQSVVYITGSLKDIWLAIPLVEKAFLKFSSVTCDAALSFTITLRHYEEKAPDPPVTPPSPYPPSGIDTEIAIHLTGKTVDEFNDVDFTTDFQDYLQKAAFKFCDRHHINYNSSKLADETVFLSYPEMCSDKWPDYESCVQVLLAVFVTLPRTEYELTVSHLKQFWAEIEENGLPNQLGVQPYQFPNVALQILWWLGWLLLAIVITSFIGGILWRVQRNADDTRQYLLEEEEERRKESIFRGVELRRKQDQRLKPAKHQKIPEFMKNNGDSISAASSSPTTKRPFLKGLFTKNSEPKVEKRPPSPLASPSSPIVESGPNRFFKPMFQEEEEDIDA